jgi:hypothetical protein
MTAEEFASLIPPIKSFNWTLACPVPAREPSPAAPVVKHGCQYLCKAFESDLLIDDAKRILGGVDFDTVVGTGLSGTIAGTLIAYALKKHLLIVRKPTDQTPLERQGKAANHSGHVTEGRMGKRWIFVDDLISSGETCARVKMEVEEANARYDVKATWVGTYTYGELFQGPIFIPPFNEQR